MLCKMFSCLAHSQYFSIYSCSIGFVETEFNGLEKGEGGVGDLEEWWKGFDHGKIPQSSQSRKVYS